MRSFHTTRRRKSSNCYWAIVLLLLLFQSLCDSNTAVVGAAFVSSSSSISSSSSSSKTTASSRQQQPNRFSPIYSPLSLPPSKHQYQSAVSSIRSRSSTSLSLSLFPQCWSNKKWRQRRTQKCIHIENDVTSAQISPRRGHKRQLVQRFVLRRLAALLLAAFIAFSSSAGGPKAAWAVHDPFSTDPLMTHDPLVPSIQRPVPDCFYHHTTASEHHDDDGSALDSSTTTTTTTQKNYGGFKRKLGNTKDPKTTTTTTNKNLPSKAKVAALAVATGLGTRLAAQQFVSNNGQVGDTTSNYYLQRKRHQRANQMVQELLQKTEQRWDTFADQMLQEDEEDFLFPLNATVRARSMAMTRQQQPPQLILSNLQRARKKVTSESQTTPSTTTSADNNVDVEEEQRRIEERSVQAKVTATQTLRAARTTRQNITQVGQVQREQRTTQLQQDKAEINAKKQAAQVALQLVQAKRQEMKQRSLLSARLQRERSHRLELERLERKRLRDIAERNAEIRRQEKHQQEQKALDQLKAAQRQERTCRKLMEERFHRELIDSLCRKRAEKRQQQQLELEDQSQEHQQHHQPVSNTATLSTTATTNKNNHMIPFYATMHQRQPMAISSSIQDKLEDAKRTLEATKKELLSKRGSPIAAPEQQEDPINEQALEEERERNIKAEATARALLQTRLDLQARALQKQRSLREEATHRGLLETRLVMERAAKLQTVKGEAMNQEATHRALLETRLALENKARSATLARNNEAAARALLAARLEMPQNNAPIIVSPVDEATNKEAQVSLLSMVLNLDADDKKQQKEAAQRALLETRLGMERRQNEDAQDESLLSMVLKLDAEQKAEAVRRALLEARLEIEARQSSREPQVNETSIIIVAHDEPVESSGAEVVPQRLFSTSAFLRQLQEEGKLQENEPSLEPSSKYIVKNESATAELTVEPNAARIGVLQQAFNETVGADQLSPNADTSSSTATLSSRDNEPTIPRKSSPQNMTTSTQTAELMPGLRVVVSRSKQKKDDDDSTTTPNTLLP